MRLILELPATGGVVPSYSLSTMKLIRYVSTFDYFVLVCEAIFCAFIIYYIVEEALELLRWRFYYFCSFWTYIDLAVIGVGYVVLWRELNNIVLRFPAPRSPSAFGAPYWSTRSCHRSPTAFSDTKT